MTLELKLEIELKLELKLKLELRIHPGQNTEARKCQHSGKQFGRARYMYLDLLLRNLCKCYRLRLNGL